MDEKAADERGITVQELRDQLGLTRYEFRAVSGLLRRLMFGSFGQCPDIVLRIKPAHGTFRSGPLKYRYLVKRKNNIATAFQKGNQ